VDRRPHRSDPLNDLTDAVEQVAETTDVSRRLDPGGDDELGRLRRTFNHLLAALEASEDAQRQLVLDASHELRTPLTSLRTNLEVVRRVDELAPADREVLVTDVVTQMGELTKLVGDLAELARGEQRERVRAPFRLDQLVEDAVAVAATHGRTRDIRFDALIEPCWVEGLPERITRAVGNLLDNAIKWSPPGGVIEVYCQEGEVTVRDHGPGISPEDLPHIFDRFYRARRREASPAPGSGSRSWPRWPTTRAGPLRRRRPRAAARCSGFGSRSSPLPTSSWSTTRNCPAC